MTQEEKIEHLAKAVMTLSELGDCKTAYVLNEIRLEIKSQLELPEGLEEAAKEYATKWHKRPDGSEWKSIYPAGTTRDFIAGAEWQKAKMMEEAVEADIMLTLHDKTGDVSLHTGYLPKELGIKCSDKVRVIVIKEG